MKKHDKKAIEMGFNWIFAIIAGVFILFFAIYTATKIIGTQEKILYTETCAKIAILFDPLETGLASGKSSEINFRKDMRIYSDYCNYNDNKPFGRQTISCSEKTFGEEFGEKGERISIKDKYVFAENIVEGKKIYLFSKPFFMPFKVADLTIVFSDDYCFYDTPDDIANKIEGLNIKGIHFPNETEGCKGIRICFKDYSNCNIKVYESEKYVEKNGKRLYYYENLIYGAIFSSPQIYECNVRRLMNKVNELGNVYLDKIKIIERKKCDPRIEVKLASFMENAKNLVHSSELQKFAYYSEEINDINEASNPGCELFS